MPAFNPKTVFAPDPDATSALAAAMAPAMRAPGIIFLSGEIGAGKTHWTRALLRALGETHAIPSPTFPLAQTYHPAAAVVVHHLDFYRLSRNEWRCAGMDEFLNDPKALRIVEWPERADGLPRPDLVINFQFAKNGGRKISLAPQSEIGEKWIQALA